jgi:uncharacterized membrane protein
MSGPQSNAAGTLRRLHTRSEQYTPDGTLGRLLLAVTNGSLISVLVLFGLIGFFGLSVFWTPIALVLFGLSTALTVVTLVALWPVYLTLIGTVDSTRAYADAVTGTGDEDEKPEEQDPVTVLKREYAAGNISDAEFERRLDKLIDGPRSRERTGDRTNDEFRTLAETE